MEINATAIKKCRRTHNLERKIIKKSNKNSVFYFVLNYILVRQLLHIKGFLNK